MAQLERKEVLVLKVFLALLDFQGQEVLLVNTKIKLKVMGYDSNFIDSTLVKITQETPEMQVNQESKEFKEILAKKVSKAKVELKESQVLRVSLEYSFS